jgi:hypothetical protein
MGFPYNDLVTSAILFGNPGITREELVELLANTHSASTYEYGPDEPWDSYTPESQDDLYHRGLGGLAGLLGLKVSRYFEGLVLDESGEIKEDSNGLVFDEPHSWWSADRNDPDHYHVIVHEENVLGEIVNEQHSSVTQLEPGYNQRYGGFIREIVSEKELEVKEDDSADLDPFWDGPDLPEPPRWEYMLKIQQVSKRERKEKFATEEELYEQWPRFHPANVYDWSQESGELNAGVFGRDRSGRNNFGWVQREGKYFLDEETFDRIPASIRSGMLGYTDLVLTWEAIKHKAWKILSRRGLKHFPRFLADFPEARKAYERAVLDSQLSMFAKMQGMTVSDFLRFRLLPRGVK